MAAAAAAGATSLSSAVLLNNGLRLPVVGLGVYRSEPGATTREAVLSALRLGYRHVDTAQFYGNEADVGEAVHASGLPREEVWITSKVPPQTWADPQAAFRRTLEAVQASVRRVGCGPIDLMLLHAPGPAEGRAEAWRALEAALDQGLLRSIGVSNFGVAHLNRLAESSAVPPAVNQIELHPWLQRPEVVAHCQGKGIVIEAYSPLAKARKLSDPAVAAVAQRLGRTPAQVLLRWSLQRGCVPLPKSIDPGRQESNSRLFDFQLEAEDMRALDALEADLVTGWDPIRQDPV